MENESKKPIEQKTLTTKFKEKNMHSISTKISYKQWAKNREKQCNKDLYKIVKEIFTK